MLPSLSAHNNHLKRKENFFFITVMIAGTIVCSLPLIGEIIYHSGLVLIFVTVIFVDAAFGILTLIVE